MNRRTNLLAAAVIVGGFSLLGEPPAASATYLDPFRGSGTAINYCCSTGRANRCCSPTGCATTESFCVPMR